MITSWEKEGLDQNTEIFDTYDAEIEDLQQNSKESQSKVQEMKAKFETITDNIDKYKCEYETVMEEYKKKIHWESIKNFKLKADLAMEQKWKNAKFTGKNVWDAALEKIGG